MLVSTRGGGAVTASRAILTGIAPDGGLYAPDQFPTLSMEDILALASQPYAERARRILSLLLDDFTPEEIEYATTSAYGSRFEQSEPAPLRRLNGNTGLLELYHGPTLAFKDMALQILPYLMSIAAKKNGMTDEICILVATSGDTGKAALEGFCDVPGTRCIVFYPKDGVSRAQYLQMATQAGGNTHVIAVEGNFDDAQNGVKRIFGNAQLKETLSAQHRVLSSANSINYGRLVPQVVYYFSAYADMVKAGSVKPGMPVNFVVPTGNFGNILAAEYARKMGLPIGKLLCASNANRVLSDFMHSGIYDINRSFHKTQSPSMDILISSNLERYLFELSGRDSGQVCNWMSSLAQSKRYAIGKELLSKLHESMHGDWISDQEGQATIMRYWRGMKALLDPHTAVAAALLDRYRAASADQTPAVIVSTASPYKFGRAVALSLGVNNKDDFECCTLLEKTSGIPIPESIRSLQNLPVRHTMECTPDTMQDSLMTIFDEA